MPVIRSNYRKTLVYGSKMPHLHHFTHFGHGKNFPMPSKKFILGTENATFTPISTQQEFSLQNKKSL